MIVKETDNISNSTLLTINISEAHSLTKYIFLTNLHKMYFFIIYDKDMKTTFIDSHIF